VALFYGLTLALTTVVTVAWSAAGRGFQGSQATLVLNLCMLLPGGVALTMQRWVFREPIAAPFALRRPSWRWLLLAWLGAAAIMLLALAVALLVPGHHFSLQLPGLAAIGMTPDEISKARAVLPASAFAAIAALLVQGLLLGPTLCLLGGLGEELAWRGFLHAELAPLGFWRRSSLIGALWGVWHLPAVFQGYAYPHHPWLGSLLLLALTQSLAPIYSRLRDGSGSIFVPGVFHGTCGAASVVALAFVDGGSELTRGFTGLAGLMAVLAVGALLATGVRPRQSSPRF
jgi:membrane protease YdiL (CAAX protease family)